MEKCKICGKEFKNVHGLSLHLYAAHKMKKAEYDEKYGDSPSQVDLQENSLQGDKEEETPKIPIENQDEKIIEQKINEDPVITRISIVEWLDKKMRSEWVAVFEEDGVMQTAEPVAVGIISTETEQFPGLLIMSVDGRLLPPWLFENFRGFFTYKELRAIEKRRKEEEKLQRKMRVVGGLRGKYQESQQRQERQLPVDLLDKIKSSMNETERSYKNTAKPNIFNIDMQHLAKQSNNILSFKRKR